MIALTSLFAVFVPQVQIVFGLVNYPPLLSINSNHTLVDWSDSRSCTGYVLPCDLVVGSTG